MATNNFQLTRLRRIEGVESEVQYLRNQMEKMRELLEQSRAQLSPESRLSHSPSQLRARQQVCHESACSSSGTQHPPPRNHNHDFGAISSMESGYSNGHQYQRSLSASIPTLSPNEVSAQPLYAPNRVVNRPLKRKRSGFEIREDPIADFVDKGLITFDCAVSYFNTYVYPRMPHRLRP